jgi:hypothetical protein
MDFERLRDIPYLLQVLADSGQPMEVRVHVLRRLRSRPATAGDRSTVAGALRHLLSTDANSDLRLQIVLALGAFTDITGVLSALGSLAMEPEESIDLRYSAFTSLERAGPTSECINLMRQLSNDEILGCTARAALMRWRLA